MLQLLLVGMFLAGLGLMLWGFNGTRYHAHHVVTGTPATTMAERGRMPDHWHPVDHLGRRVTVALHGTHHEHDHPYGWPTTGPNRKATNADDA